MAKDASGIYHNRLDTNAMIDGVCVCSDKETLAIVAKIEARVYHARFKRVIHRKRKSVSLAPVAWTSRPEIG